MHSHTETIGNWGLNEAAISLHLVAINNSVRYFATSLSGVNSQILCPVPFLNPTSNQSYKCLQAISCISYTSPNWIPNFYAWRNLTSALFQQHREGEWCVCPWLWGRYRYCATGVFLYSRWSTQNIVLPFSNLT